MRIYPSCHVYVGSAGAELSLCGHCCNNFTFLATRSRPDRHAVVEWIPSLSSTVLDRMGIYSTTACQSGRERVARHDRLAAIFLRWIESPEGLAFQGNVFRAG